MRATSIPMTVPDPTPPNATSSEVAWLRAFHSGSRKCMAECYEDHFDLVSQAVGAILTGADRETVVHELFFRLLSEPSLRSAFQGGSLPAWLRLVSRNQAIDHARRRRLEVLLPDLTAAVEAALPKEDHLEQRMHIHLTLERFRAQVLPPKWGPVFQARFVEHQDQPTAARALGIGRTTLAYQEYRIRSLLRRFVLKGEQT